MLFKPALCWAILDGRKTQARRLVKPGEACRDGLSVSKTWAHQVIGIAWYRVWVPYYATWVVGKTYAIQPGRGKPAIWVGPDGVRHESPLVEYVCKTGCLGASWGAQVKRWLREHGYREARLVATGIRRERLRDITPNDVRAELGFYTDVMFDFIDLWNSIHSKRGTRWADNPEV